MIVTDLDGTLLGDEAALSRFREWLAAEGAERRLVYASGRSVVSVLQLVGDAVLPKPDAIISGVGSEIHDASGIAWPGWLERFRGWHADRVRATLQPLRWLEPQAEEHQTPLKASYDLRGMAPSDARAIRRSLSAAGISASLVYSADRYLDVLHVRAGKGRAARFLADGWSIPIRDVLAFGDSGNDLDLLSSGFRGTLVANALPELSLAVPETVYRSPEMHADGVLDGIRFWSGG